MSLENDVRAAELAVFKSIIKPTAAQVRAVRTWAAMTQKEAGAIIGTTQKTWQGWESGRPMPGAKFQLFVLKMS